MGTERLKELLERARVGSCVPTPDGSFHVSFDGGIDVGLIVEGRELVMESEMCVLPPDGDSREQTLVKLLRTNSAALDEQGAAMYLDESGTVVSLCKKVPFEGLEPHQFEEALSGFLTDVESRYAARGVDPARPATVPASLLPPQALAL